MAKVINRDVPIAEENTTLTGQPATNMYDDWSEEMEDRADNVYDDTKKKSAGNKKSKEKKLKEIDEVVKEDLEQLFSVVCLVKESRFHQNRDSFNE